MGYYDGGDTKIITIQRCSDCPHYRLRSVSMVGNVEDAGHWCMNRREKLDIEDGCIPKHRVSKDCTLADFPM